MASRQLVLLRHAKSSWDDAQLDDQDRPLAPRGRRAATKVGKYLRREGIEPDLVLCSSAARARQTFELLQLGPKAEVLFEDGLYGASAGALLARLRKVRDSAGSVIVIGHNPGIEDLAVTLVGGGEGLAEKFPTAALADLRVPIVAWGELRPDIARLHVFIIPKPYSGTG
jgi:phosphohistidine phosphatase